MSKLPITSAKKVMKVLRKNRFTFLKYSKHTHAVFIKDNNPDIMVVVPLHKEIKRGTLQNIIKQSGISRNDFLKQL